MRCGPLLLWPGRGGLATRQAPRPAQSPRLWPYDALHGYGYLSSWSVQSPERTIPYAGRRYGNQEFCGLCPRLAGAISEYNSAEERESAPMSEVPERFNPFGC